MTPRRNIPGLLVIAALLGIALLLPACAKKQVKSAPASPGERGTSVGVALFSFVVDDDPFDDTLKTGEAPRALPASTQTIAEVLSEYSNRVVPVTPAVRSLWRANGLRLISVPRRDLDYVMSKLRLVGSMEQQWVGESTRWIDAAHSPKWDQSEAIMLDDGPLALGPGRLRILMRCWAAPASPLANAEIAANPATKLESGCVAGAIQLEVVPQHVGRAEHEDISAILKPKPTIEAEGVTFPRLLLEASLTTDDLLLIVPERPDAEWRPKAATSDAPGAHPLGPPLPPSPTLGELMLTDLSSGAHRNLRRIIVISPIPPKKYNLLAQR